MRKIFFFFLFSLLLRSAPATEYFVGPKGNDASPGTDEQTPFLTIQRGVDAAKSGDTVTVLDGVYHEMVKINHSGDAHAPITIRSKDRWAAKVIGTTQDGFTIGSLDTIDVGYITIQGFDIKAPGTYSCGVASAYKAHHLIVENCYAHDCGSSGIQLNDGDYRIARNNVCAHNGWLMPYCGSGISFYGLIKFDDAPGNHAVISGNICYANDNGPGTRMTDGNGIIIDDFRDAQEFHTTKPPANIHYAGADSLIEGNLVFNNGGRGIHVYKSNQVKVVNNTSTHNMQRDNQHVECGEIEASASDNIVIANNIAITATVPVHYAGKPNAAYLILSKPGDEESSTNITFQNDLAFDTASATASPVNATGIEADFATAKGNLAATDPKLLNSMASELLKPDLPPTTDFASFFGLAAGSTAIGAGAKIDGTDFAIQPSIDRGAFQQSPAH